MGYKRVREAKEFVKSAPQKAEELKNSLINAIVGVDDGVQSFVRTKALGLMDDGSMLPEGAKLGTVRELLGSTVFAKSPAGFSDTAYRMEDTAAGVAATLAARGLQAGAVTAAGVGLLNATQSMFGTEADQQERGQLPLY